MLGIRVSDRLRDAAEQMLSLLSTALRLNTLFVAVNDGRTNEIIRVVNRSEILTYEGALPFVESYCSHVCREASDAVIIADTETDPLTAGMNMTRTLGHCGFIGVPIVLQDGTKSGTVCGLDRETREFSETEVRLLQVAANFIGYVIDLERSSYVDDMTGAFTRPYLRKLFEEWAEARRRIALFYFDLDNFKYMNDTEGHEFGDQVLRSVARQVRDLIGDRGSLIRLGGDEFAVLWADCSSKGEAMGVANELLNVFSTPISVGGHELKVTASMGVSIYPDYSKSLRDLLNHADSAMYDVKRRGSDGVKFYGLESGSEAFGCR